MKCYGTSVVPLSQLTPYPSRAGVPIWVSGGFIFVWLNEVGEKDCESILRRVPRASPKSFRHT